MVGGQTDTFRNDSKELAPHQTTNVARTQGLMRDTLPAMRGARLNSMPVPEMDPPVNVSRSKGIKTAV